mmetsp:Transcript_33782/g.74840  ORF Transcript_33782/g.74840 Transcript_33782/m.74840 type:complete len:130 (-) Transcript_33782:40-429(-)
MCYPRHSHEQALTLLLAFLKNIYTLSLRYNRGGGGGVLGMGAGGPNVMFQYLDIRARLVDSRVSQFMWMAIMWSNSALGMWHTRRGWGSTTGPPAYPGRDMTSILWCCRYEWPQAGNPASRQLGPPHGP